MASRIRALWLRPLRRARARSPQRSASDR
jgi:hypothetical protein